MEISPAVVQKILSALEDQPHRVFRGAGYSARVAIPDYDEHLDDHYRARLRVASPGALETCHFGVIIEFDQSTQIRVHEDGRLDETLRGLLTRFGPVLLRNVRLPDRDRTSAQRNIFPSLKFHIDRSHLQAEQISMFWRDPRDPVQREPRHSSTLVMPTHAARLQALAEGHSEFEAGRSYSFFGDTDVSALIGKTLLELPWNAASGIGEISLLDNRTVLHASYYPRSSDKGYPISVRYLL